MTTAANQINDVINNIANKLGTTAEMLAPEYAKYVIAESTVSLIGDVIMFLLFIGVLAYCVWFLKKRPEYCEDPALWAIVLSLIGCGIFGSFALNSLSMIAKANASPAALMMEYIVSNVR